LKYVHNKEDRKEHHSFISASHIILNLSVIFKLVMLIARSYLLIDGDIQDEA